MCKSPYKEHIPSPSAASMPRPFRVLLLVGLFAVLYVTLQVAVLGPRGECLASLGLGQAPIEEERVGHKTRVDVYVLSYVIDGREVFVMSKCPDAEDGEATIAKVMEKVGTKVSLNFTYIATYFGHIPSNDRPQNTTDGTELICKHGPTECLANRQQLWYVTSY